MASDLKAVRNDPRYLEACKFFGMWDWGWGMPSDPHARENLRHATGLLAAGDSSAAGFLEVVLGRYFGDKYRGTIRAEAERIARNAARSAAERIETGERRREEQ